MKTWKITLCLTLLVAASILLGVWIGYRAALRSKNNQQVIAQSWHKRAIKSLNDKLSLTDQQRIRVDQLVSAAVKEFQGLKETTLSREREIIQQLVKAVEAELGDCGRVLIRASGTEPLVRVMVEAATAAQAQAAAERLAAVVKAELAP